MYILYLIIFLIINIYFNFIFDKYILKKFCCLKGCKNIYCKDYKKCPYSKYFKQHINN